MSSSSSSDFCDEEKFYTAIVERDAKTVKSILEKHDFKSLDINIKRDGLTAIQQAAVIGFTEGCRLIFENRGYFEIEDDAGSNSCLALAVKHRHYETFKVLMESIGHNKIIDRLDHVLVEIARYSDVGMFELVVRVLGDSQRDVKYSLQKISHRRTEEDVFRTLQFVAKHHPDPNKVVFTHSILHVCIGLHKSISEWMIKEFKERGLSLLSKKRSSILQRSLCFKDGDTTILQKLLEAGVDPNKDATDNYCAFFSSAQSGNVKALELLLRYGCEIDVPIRDFGGYMTPLEVAAQNGHFDACKFLLENGAHPTKTVASTKSRTAFFLALANGHARIVDLLLSTGKILIKTDVAEVLTKHFSRTRAAKRPRS